MPGLIVDGVQQTETEAHYKSTIKYLTVPPEKHSDPDFSSDDVDTIKALEDSTRREIYDKMQGSTTETFNYADRATAEKHWVLRMGTIDAMKRMNAKTLDYYYDNPKKGIPIKEPGNKWKKGTDATFLFKAKSGISSTDALDQLESGKTRGECLGAIRACYLIGARKAHGDTQFDIIHPAGSLDLGATNAHSSSVTDTSTHIPGDYRYFKNKNNYGALTLAKTMRGGIWRGENCVYMGGGKYSGLGLSMLDTDQLRATFREYYAADTGVELLDDDANANIRWTVHKRAKLTP